MMCQTEKKRINPNILLFVLAMLFLAAGFRGDFFRQMKTNLISLGTGLYSGRVESISSFIGKTDKLTSEALRYHDSMLDLDSAKENLLGTRVVITEDATVVKTDSGRLIDPYKDIYMDSVLDAADKIGRIQTLAEAVGAKFLCCPVPCGGVYETTPRNMPNYDRAHYNAIIEELSIRNIPSLILLEEFTARELPEDEVFFRTDHHWKPATGFQVNRLICNELSARYGFQTEKEALDSANFKTDTYPNWFLGSYGKKVGRFFTWQGAEEFEVITPMVPTDFSETVRGREAVRTGPFKETVLYPEYLEKDYYHTKNYCVYSGGDFHLQVIQNRLRPDGAKILVIRDSFACVVTPFLALQAGELHVVDERNADHVFGEAVDLESYIKTIRPDYIIIMKDF